MAEPKNEIVDVAQGMLSGDISLVLGARRLCILRHELRTDDLKIFNAIVALESETDSFPLGQDREMYAEDTLRQLDGELAVRAGAYREEVLGACRAIIEAIRSGQLS